MKKIIYLLILALLISTKGFCADTKTTALDAISSATTTDMLYVISDPSGTPVSENILVGALFNVATDLNGSGEVIGGDADTVVTNANLTGPITSSGNATSVAAQTGTGSVFVMQASPTLTTPDIGTPSAGFLINATGLPLATGTTGNYVATIAGTADQIDVSGSGSETAAVTLSLPSAVVITNTLTITGTAASSGNDCLQINTTGVISNTGSSCAAGGSASDSFQTWNPDNGTSPVASSATDTMTVTDGSGINVTGDSGTDALTFAITIKANSENAVGVVQSASGLEFESNDLTLLQGCADNEVLKWDETDDDWNCEADAGGSSNSFETHDTPNGTDPVASSSTDTLTWTDGDGIDITGDSGTDAITIAITLKTASEDGVGATSSPSGMEFESTELTLLQGCSDNQILKWDETQDDWNCESDGGGGGGTANLVVDMSVQQFKITGSFVTAGDATIGAGIDAGQGHWRMLFDEDVHEGAVYQFRMPNNYASNPILNVHYSMVSATAGNVEWEGRIMCVSPDDAVDIGAEDFAAVSNSIEVVPGTVGYMSTAVITLTDDSCAAGDSTWIHVATDADGNDAATGDREAVNVTLSYTGS